MTMKLQYFSWLLTAVIAVLFAGTGSAHDSMSYGSKPTSSEITTTITTTTFTTVTQTSVILQTKTRGNPCPPKQTGTLDFDDLDTSGISPMPLIYQDFNFPATSSWEVIASGSFASTSAEYRSVNSCPNGLLSRGSGPVSFNSKGQNFSFDITSASFFAFADSPAVSLTVEVNLLMADGYTETHYFEVPNGALDASAPLVLGADELSGFKDLVEVQVAAWVSYDDHAGTGVSGEFVIDDIVYVKRSCKTAY